MHTCNVIFDPITGKSNYKVLGLRLFCKSYDKCVCNSYLSIMNCMYSEQQYKVYQEYLL